MAYCLRSFVQILEQVLHPDKHHKKWILDHDKIPQVQSLWETTSFLRDFLDNSSPLIQAKIALLEDQIMAAAEKAEDTLETYLTSQLLSNLEGQAFTISPPDLGEAIQAFEKAKQEVIKIMDSCQRPDDNVPLSTSTTRYPNHNNVVVGVSEDLKQLRNRLTSRASELDIIPIVGMGGMGKTTLARILYDQFSSTSKSHFDCSAWVTVSQTYNPQLILRTLLASATRKPSNEISREQTSVLIVTLYKTLYGRRYLIVLDDIWSHMAWDDVQRAFPRDNKGSRIILTTRENIVADYVNPSLHEMHLITKDESWELLRRKVFGEESCPCALEEVGKSIARSCGGLPLALQVIGGLLSQSQRSIDFWKYVANNARSLIAETDEQFSGIFHWSFAHLPHYLKPCFLYMARFQEDEEITTSKIIKLWVAEGFVYPIRDKSLEEAVRIHLNALIDRNLIFVREKGKSGSAKSFGIHDLLRDLCLSKAQEKKFLYLKDLQTDNLQEDIYLGRIISVTAATTGTYPLPILTPFTRSFQCCNNSENAILSYLCIKLSLLRVLDFGYMDFVEFPVVILQLVNLRYLHIWWSKGYIPESISVLRNLQTLITFKLKSLARILPVMPQLRHIKFYYKKKYSKSKLEYGVHENLQSLCRVPAKEVRKLLGKLPNLKKLEFVCDEEFIDLTCFHNLETLNILELSHNMTFSVSLKKLSLWHCKTDESVLDEIGALPNLQILILYYGINEKMDWEPCEGGFPELKYLEIINWKLEKWLATEVHFPVLEHLILQFCEHLIEIPYEFGDITTLKIIDVNQCLPSVVESARRIYEDQCQFGNTGLQLLGIDPEEEEEEEEEEVVVVQNAWINIKDSC